jgi:hypothetical protein
MFVPLDNMPGKIYVPDEIINKKNDCKDCYSCQFCPDVRCSACLKKKSCLKKIDL